MKNLKKLVLLFTVGIVISSGLFSSIGPLVSTVSAATDNPPNSGQATPYVSDTIPDQVKAYVYARAVGACILNSQLHDETGPFAGYNIINEDSASSFTWFGGGKTQGDTDTFTGYLDPDNQDGKSSCHDMNGQMLQDAYNIFQMGGATDGLTAACNSGFVRFEGDHDNDTPDECSRGTGQLGRAGNNKPLAAAKYLQNLVADYYGQPGSKLPGLTDPMKWYFYFNSLQTLCHGTERDNPGSYTDQDIKNNNKLVKTVGPDGKSPVVFELGNGQTASSLVTIATADNFQGHQSMFCGQLAQAAANAAPAYAAAVAADPNSAGDDSSGDDTTATCENSGGFLAWVMCGILDGLANAVGHAYTDLVQPLLKTPPLDVAGGSSAAPNPQSAGLKKAWSNFRDIADVLLVIGLLVVVFGESLGGGLIDAYTAKKVLPRVLSAAILINLSYYLVAIGIDISNILGVGIGDLLTKSFGMGSIAHAHFTSVSNSTSSTAGIVSVSGGTVAIGIAVLIPHLFAVIGTAGAAGGIASMLEGLLFVVLVPALLVVIAIIATLCIRIGLIYLLVVLAPVAFACYCLPNTEPYFRRWWKLMQETLLIYPIISIMFALSLILAQSTSWATTANGPVLAGVGYLVSLVMLILPLVGIPFAFRIAGGILGRVHELTHGAGKRGIQEGLLKGRREAAAQKAGVALGQGRAKMYRKYEGGGAGGRFLARRIASYQDIRELEAGRNAETIKRMQATNDTGDDSVERALSVNKAWADAQRAQGLGQNVDWKDDAKTGRKMYRTAGGAWVGEGEVDEAYRLYGHNNAAKQWSLGHEMEKAATQEENDYLAGSMGRLLGSGGSWGLEQGEAKGVLKGAAFSKQAVDRQWKHYDLDYDNQQMNMGTGNALTLFREIDEKQGSYAMMQQNAETWTTMSQAMEDANGLLSSGGGTAEQQAQAREILTRGSRIAYATRSSSMADTPIPGADGGDATPPPVRGAGGQRAVGAGAAGRVQEEIGRFVSMSEATAGAYQPPSSTARPPSPLTGGAPAPRPAAPARENLDRRENPSDANGTGTGGSAPRVDGF